jgi:hypothetical protein
VTDAAQDAYLWAELVDRVLDWEAADIAQRRRAESIALLTLSAAPPPDALRDLSAMTSGIMAEALKRVADNLEKSPPRRDEDEPR